MSDESAIALCVGVLIGMGLAVFQMGVWVYTYLYWKDKR